MSKRRTTHPHQMIKDLGYYDSKDPHGGRVKAQGQGRATGSLTYEEMARKQEGQPQYQIMGQAFGQEVRTLVRGGEGQRPRKQTKEEAAAIRKLKIPEAEQRLARLRGYTPPTAVNEWTPADVNWSRSGKGKRYSPLRDAPTPMTAREAKPRGRPVPRSFREALLDKGRLDTVDWMEDIESGEGDAGVLQMQYPTDYVKEGQSHTIMNKNENSTIHSTNVMRYDSKVAGSEGRRRVANVPESLRAKPFEAGPVLLGDKDILKRNHQLQVMSRSRRHMKNFMPTSSAHQMGQTKPFA